MPDRAERSAESAAPRAKKLSILGAYFSQQISELVTSPGESFNMSWRPLPRIAFAVATYPFSATSPADLPLEIGDELYIIEQGGHEASWFRGYLVAPPSLLAGLTSVKGQTLEARVFSGIFPKSCVEVREVLADTVVDGHAHGAQMNGDGPQLDPAHQGSPHRANSSLRKASVQQAVSNSSISPNGGAVNGEISRVDSNTTRLTRPSSQRTLNRSGSQTLARKLSHRSITSSQPRMSPVPHISPHDSPHEPKPQRPQAPVPMLKIGDETPTSSSEPLVDEIASCLREWHSKNLHELLLARRYPMLEKISDLVNRLDVARRQLLHGVLTAQESSALREEIVWNLVDGNKMLDNEVIVRCPDQRGRLLTGDDSAIDMTKLQSTMSLLERPPVFPHDSINLYHLMVNVKNFGISGSASHTLIMYICSRNAGESPKALTESFVVDLPRQEEFEESAAGGKYQTLFTDITPSEIGDESRPGVELYLVVKVQINQTIKRPSTSTPRTGSQADGNVSPGMPPISSFSTTSSSSSKVGRQSLMWAQKRFGSVRGGQQHDSKPQPAPASPSASSSSESGLQPVSQDAARPSTQHASHSVKKNVGLGVLNVRDLFRHDSAVDQQISIWAPDTKNNEAYKSADDWDDFVCDLVTNWNGSYTKLKTLDHIRLGLQSFANPDSSDLITKTPTLLQNIIPTQKMSFPGAPTKARSDIYLKLSDAFLPPQALLSHPERGTVQISPNMEYTNIQLTLEVRKRSGERVERCIFPGSNSLGQTAWRTSAVDRGQAWNEMIKLVIPTQDVPEAHLIMSIADAPGFPFALAWMPLWNEGAFMKDGAHAPLLYVYDRTTSGSDKGRGAYLGLPWDSKGKDGDKKDEALTGPVATLNLETELCSTFFSQDTNLLGILRWRDQPRERLLELLQRFAFVPEIEVVKLVGDVFEALFGILVENSGREDFEDSVFEALVTLLGKLHDRRFNMGAFANVYADLKFDHPFATPCLIRSYLRLLSNPSDPNKSRRVRATFKVGRQILRFIVRARTRLEAKEADIGANTQSTFKGDLRSIFNAFEDLMKDKSPIMVGSKTLVVQHIHTWLPELKPVFSEEEILQIARAFLESCAGVQGKLILYKLVLILNLTNEEMFSEPDIRQKISDYTINWIDPYWGSDTGHHLFRDQVRLCCSIVSKQASESQLDNLSLFTKTIHSYRSILIRSGEKKDQLSLLFPTTYPFPSKPISNPAPFDESLTELAALLATLADRLCANKGTGPEDKRTALLFESLDVLMSVLSGEAFPKGWLSLYVFHHKSSLKMLETLLGIIANDYIPPPEDADEFNTDLWSKYLLTLLTLVRSDTLALETFPEQKRRAVWKIAGDVREQGADLLRRSWDAIGWESSPEEQRRYGLLRLGGFQVQYVPTLVAPIVELCLSVHEGLRNVAVRILQAMIVSEWTLNEDLSAIQIEMINCFETLFQAKNIGESLVQKTFVNELLELFGPLAAMPLDPMWQAIKDTITTIDELFELLAAVHSPDITEALRIMNTLQLMNFLKDMHKEDIYIRYVHQLAHVQARLDNKAEAGLALRLHADLYSWDSGRLGALADPEYPEQSAFERKEQLYFEMIKYFEEGEAWGCALASYQELADQYEHVQFDFFKLARAQRSMATIYEIIAKGEWVSPRYFRVVYHGMGFPSNLRGKQFVYEGEPGERQSLFTDRMLQIHPSAQMMQKGEIDDIEGQYLQISPLSPYRDLDTRIYHQPKVAQAVRDYVSSSKPHIFAVTTKRHSPSSGVHNQWIEKTLYSTKESFPTILRRSEVVAIDVLQLSPLQTAVERTVRKTSELATLERKVDEMDDSTLQNLADAILTSVDPSATASVSQYHHLLPQPPDSPKDESGEPSPSADLEDALQIALLEHVSMIKHCLTHFVRADHFQTRTFLFENLQETFAPEMAVLAPVAALEIAVPDLLSSPDRSIADGPTVPPPPDIPLTNGHTIAYNNDTSPVDRSRTISSRLSLNLLKTNSTAPARTNGSVSGPSASASLDDGSSSHFSQAKRKGDTESSLNQTVPLPMTNGHVNGGDDDVAGAEENRPLTAASGKSQKLKQRLSSLGMRRVASKNEKGKSDGMDHVTEE
ncbi:Deoxycytidine kinase 1 [Lecanora helva]